MLLRAIFSSCIDLCSSVPHPWPKCIFPARCAMEKISAPRGFADTLPGESWKWQVVERIARQTAATYHFAEIRTPCPILESTQLFHRGVDGTSASGFQRKFTFNDRGGDSMTLAQGTAGVARAVIENNLAAQEGARVKGFLHRPEFPRSTAAKGPTPPTPSVWRGSFRRGRAGPGCRVHPAANGFLFGGAA